MSDHPWKNVSVRSFIVDDLDSKAISEAIDRRKRLSEIMPDGDSDEAGALLAEVCRGWLEFIEQGREKMTP